MHTKRPITYLKDILSCDICHTDIDTMRESYQTCDACLGDFCHRHYTYIKNFSSVYCTDCFIVMSPIFDQINKLQTEYETRVAQLKAEAVSKAIAVTKEKRGND